MSRVLKKKRLSVWNRVGQFFFAEEVPYGLAMVRMVLPLVLLIPMVLRWPWARELYSTDGVTTPLAEGYGYYNYLPEFPGTVAVALHTALIVLLITTSLGWRTRISVVGATLLYTYLNMLDTVSTITKYSVIATHLLLLLSVSQCGAVWSIDAWLERKRHAREAGGARWKPQAFPVWPRRLVQLMIGFVYFGAAITKIHTPEFFSGDQLQSWLVTYVNYKHPIGELMTVYPWMLSIMAYVTVVWELMFIFVAWAGWRRKFMLSIGLMFHAMTLLTLGLIVFPMVCCSVYFAFFDEKDIRRFSIYWRAMQQKRGLSHVTSTFAGMIPSWNVPRALRFPSTIVFAIVVVGLVVLGVEVEYQRDVYGVRRPEGKHTLKPVSDERVQTLLTPTTAMREQDKFFTFDIGTFTVGGNLFDRKREFRQGDRLLAQCTMSSPHEDMVVNCNMYDAEGRVVERVSHVVTRESMRCNFMYPINESYVAGDYYVVLESGGEEIMRRKITVLPNENAAAAVTPVAN